MLKLLWDLAAITRGKLVNRSCSLFVGEGLEFMKRNVPCKGTYRYGTFSVA